MKHIAGWLSSKRLLIAQCEKAQRQLQAAWAEVERLDEYSTGCWDIITANQEERLGLIDQLHRVARERDEERRLRLEAEKKHRDIVWAWSDKQIAEAAEELRDTYLENEALKLFVHMVHKDECASLLAGNKECDCGYDTLPDFELAQAAEELREHYLENEEEK